MKDLRVSYGHLTIVITENNGFYYGYIEKIDECCYGWSENPGDELNKVIKRVDESYSEYRDKSLWEIEMENYNCGPRDERFDPEF